MLWDSLGIVCRCLVRQYLLVRDTRFLGRRCRSRTASSTTWSSADPGAGSEPRGAARGQRGGEGTAAAPGHHAGRGTYRLSAIIHDDMLQWVTVGHTRLQIARAGISDARLQAALDRVDDAVRSAITRMRGLMSELHPQVVERGFTTALREYLEQVDRDGEIHCLLEGRFAADPSGTVATTLYRIACEAVVNARKHAPGCHRGRAPRATPTEAMRCQVQGRWAGVRARGTGGSPTGHVGLTAMRERAEALGGWWTLHSRPGEGTRVEVCLPHEPVKSARSGAGAVSDAGDCCCVGGRGRRGPRSDRSAEGSGHETSGRSVGGRR